MTAPGTATPRPGGLIDRVVLVGFMAAGKSTVGGETARRLGWQLVDVDAELERRQGRSIPQIFASDGEAAFRALESALVDELLDLSEAVLVPGGGWAAWRGDEFGADSPLLSLPPHTLSVWLQVSPEAAAERASSQAASSGVGRPLLDGGDDPVSVARSLLARREPHYRLAGLHLDTEGASPVEIARRIVHRVRGEGVPGTSSDSE